MTVQRDRLKMNRTWTRQIAFYSFQRSSSKIAKGLVLFWTPQLGQEKPGNEGLLRLVVTQPERLLKTFTGLKKCGGAPKLTNLRCMSITTLKFEDLLDGSGTLS